MSQSTLQLCKSLRASTRPLLCLVLNPNQNLLAASSEEGAVKLWNLETLKVVHGFLPSCFHGGVVTCIRWSDNRTLLVSAGTSLYRLSIPEDASKLMTTVAQRHWPDVADEEINCFHVLPGSSMVILGDDSGSVSVFGLETDVSEVVEPSLSHAHICTSIALLPALTTEKEPSVHVISGGMDCLMKHWTLPAAQATSSDALVDPAELSQALPRPQITAVMNAAEQQDPDAPQLFNPPYVETIASHSSLPIVAAGLGDGSVMLARHALVKSKHKNKRLKKRVLRPTWTTSRLMGHTLPVGALCLIESDAADTKTAFTVVSGSSDCSVRVWRVQIDEQGTMTANQAACFTLPWTDEARKPKINCITSFKEGDTTKLLVGDVLGQITILTITR